MSSIENNMSKQHHPEQDSIDEDDEEEDDENESIMSSSAKRRCSHSAPIVVNFSTNLIITFALSLAIYLLMANVFLTFNKISSSWSFLTSSSPPGVLIWSGGNHNYMNGADGGSSGGDGSTGARDRSYQYYDCAKSILSMEECELLNTYHDEYLNSLRSYLTRSKSQTEQLSQLNSLKVNTSFFIH